MYVPAFLYKYAIDGDTGAGMLAATPIAAATNNGGAITGLTLHAFGQLYFMGDQLLNAALEQEDLGIISGDILKAYGPENLWKLDSVPEGYAVMPVFSEEMLGQIHNTDFAGSAVRYMSEPGVYSNGYKGLDVHQETSIGGGNLYFKPVFYQGSHLWHDRVIDFWHENPTPEEVMVGTRNMLTGVPEPLDAAARGTALSSCGSEIAMAAFIWTFNNSNVLEQTRMYASDTGYATMGTIDLTKFNEYPRYYVVSNTGDIASVMGEMDTYTVLSTWEVEQLHLAALLSMFGIPYLK
jgi:hypothetical protein